MMLLSTLLLLLPALPLSLGFADGDLQVRAKNRLQHRSKAALEKRHGGRATFFAVGLGACGDWSNPSDFIVALNEAQWGGNSYPGPNCNRAIRISYGGKSTIAIVKDQCPHGYCSYGDLDMSVGLFEFFAHQDVGVFQMNWEWADGPSEPPAPPTSTWSPPPPPTSTWQEPPPPSWTWQPPPPPSSTWEPPSSTWSPPPPPSSSSSWTPPYTPSSESTSTAAPTSSDTSSASSNSTTSSSSSASSLSFIADVVASAASSSGAPAAVQTGVIQGAGNLVLLNQAVANLGRVVVVGAQV